MHAENMDIRDFHFGKFYNFSIFVVSWMHGSQNLLSCVQGTRVQKFLLSCCSINHPLSFCFREAGHVTIIGSPYGCCCQWIKLCRSYLAGYCYFIGQLHRFSLNSWLIQSIQVEVSYGYLEGNEEDIAGIQRQFKNRLHNSELLSEGRFSLF